MTVRKVASFNEGNEVKRHANLDFNFLGNMRMDEAGERGTMKLAYLC